MNNNLMTIFDIPTTMATENSIFAGCGSKTPEASGGPSFADVLSESTEKPSATAYEDRRADSKALQARENTEAESGKATETPAPAADQEAPTDARVPVAPQADSNAENRDHRVLALNGRQPGDAGRSLAASEGRAHNDQEIKAAKSEGRRKTAPSVDTLKNRSGSPSPAARPGDDVAGGSGTAPRSKAEQTPGDAPGRDRDTVPVKTGPAGLDPKSGQLADGKNQPGLAAAAAGPSPGSKPLASGGSKRARKSSAAEAEGTPASASALKAKPDQNPTRAERQRRMMTPAEARKQDSQPESPASGSKTGANADKTAPSVSRQRGQGSETGHVTGNGPPARADSTALAAEAASWNRTGSGRMRGVPADVLRHITDRIGAQLRNGASEMRLALKPESLGHLNLNISADQNAVSVRIVAETAAAKELIETNLGQLRADLSRQGLDVKALDVDVFTANDDPRRDADNRQAAGRNGSASLSKGPQEADPLPSGAVAGRWEDGRHSLVGIYA